MKSILSFFGYTPKTDTNPEFYTNYEAKVKQTHIIDNVVNLALNNPEYLPLSEFSKMMHKSDMYDFCQSIYENVAICVNASMIPKFGFNGMIADQKAELLELIQKYKIPYQEVSMPDIHSTDNSNNNFDSNASRNLDEFYWLVMPDDFRKLLLCLPNEVGNDIRAYYIKSEHIVRAYMLYQGKYINKSKERHQLIFAENNSLQRSLSILNKKNKKLATKNQRLEDDVEELNEYITNTYLMKFILVRLNDVDPETYDYYMIYGQTKKANASYQRIHTKYPASERICVYKFTKEANIYNIITNTLGARIICEGRYIAPKNNTPYGHTKFVKKVREILESIE